MNIEGTISCLSPKHSTMEQYQMYAPSQVEQHKSKNDCWIIIHGRVLNLTKFMEEHPGGEEVLMEYAGKDATTAFSDVGHSKRAYDLLSGLQVGSLKGVNVNEIRDQTLKELPEPSKEMEAFVLQDDLTHENSIIFELLVPLFVAGLYFGYQYLAGALKFGS